MALHRETMCVYPQIYVRNGKGRYMRETMENFIVFFSFFLHCFNLSPPSCSDLCCLKDDKGRGNPSSSKLNVNFSTNPKLGVLVLYFYHRVS